MKSEQLEKNDQKVSIKDAQAPRKASSPKESFSEH